MGGFTLIELMVTLTVLAILAGISVPLYRSFTAEQRIKSAAYDFSYTLLFAREEALKRNADVSVNPCDKEAAPACPGDGWSFGWYVESDTTVLAVTPAPIRSEGDEALSHLNITPATGNAITYNGSGRLASAVTPFAITPRAANDIAPRCIAVSLSGRPRHYDSTDGECS